MRILFIAPLGRDMPSSRMRCWQVCDAWDEATCYRWNGRFPEDIKEYDVVVFHKLADPTWISMANSLKLSGVRVVLDICDPYYWWHKEYADMIQVCDKVVASSEGLVADIAGTFNREATCITDRMPFINDYKTHGLVEEPVICWFGLSINRKPSLDQSGELLKRLLFDEVSFKLRIIDEKPETPYIDESWIEHTRWGAGTIHDTLMKCDIALLPTYPGIWGAVKSKNKSATAGWAGLPVTDGMGYFHIVDLLQNHKLREQEGAESRHLSETEYNITQSVKEWKHLVLSL